MKPGVVIASLLVAFASLANADAAQDLEAAKGDIRCSVFVWVAGAGFKKNPNHAAARGYEEALAEASALSFAFEMRAFEYLNKLPEEARRQAHLALIDQRHESRRWIAKVAINPSSAKKNPSDQARLQRLLNDCLSATGTNSND